MGIAQPGSHVPRERELLGQTVVVIGGSAGIDSKRLDAPVLKAPK